jgi:hypothetical protein
MSWSSQQVSHTEVSPEPVLIRWLVVINVVPGMENPIYTFATPTIVSGDRQNVDVVAHELSHSWSGNLVTNCSWEHL